MISYNESEWAWCNAVASIEKAILRSGAKRILEVGAGANPTFKKEFLDQHGLEYTALDILQSELDKAPDCYHKVVADICAKQLDIGQKFDFVFSRMLAEHVPDGETFHRNVFHLLAPGGVAFHFFPTMWAPPFVLNRILPEKITEAVLLTIQPERAREGKQGKFPAYYSWCRGPVPSQIARLEAIGYRIESYAAFFGHRGYYKKFPPLLWLHEALCRWLIAHPIPAITSFAHLTLVRP